MSETRRDEIIYEEGWRSSTSVLPAEPDAPPVDEEEPQEEKKPSSPSFPVLLTLQLVLCLAAVLVLFLLKTMDSAVYHDFMSFYAEELNRPLISRRVFDTLDLGKLFDADLVKVTEGDDALFNQ